MPSKPFFKNMGAILLYAVVGTIVECIWNRSVSLWQMSGEVFQNVSLFHKLWFGSFIAAIDPVPVLSVFEEIHVNESFTFWYLENPSLRMLLLLLSIPGMSFAGIASSFLISSYP